jgi:GNAT superfamily N-acetyltransferase
MTFTIDEVEIPRSLENPLAADFIAADFIATVEVRNIVEADGYGSDELSATPRELLPSWLDQEYEPKRLFAARVDGRIVARSVFETRPSSEADTVWLGVQVHPEFRRRGIGAAMADELEALAVADGRSRFVVYTVSRQSDGEQLRSPTGFGSVPLRNPEVRFLLGRGYTLEQVERGSRLALPVNPVLLGDLQHAARIKAGPAYHLHHWTGSTPDRWLDDMALLYTRMSTDAPTAGLDEPEDVWTRQRLADYEARAALDGRTVVVTTVEHVASGRLVGLTAIGAPAQLDRPALQQDTIVLREHRGHRLGMLLKSANLALLEAEAPGNPSIITFNAEENRHMLDVNEALGFVPMGYEGAWKKVLPG